MSKSSDSTATTIRIVSRWDSSRVLYECEAPSDLESGLHIRHALERATAGGADLRDADLSGAVLRDADLSGADLRGADLRDADLSGAVLSDAVLRDADLSGADLRGADLRDADLSGAVLSDAVLRDADLSGAVLRGADLRDADLSGAVLSGADLRDADLELGDDVPVLPNIHQQVYEAASKPEAFDMGSWHAPCGTTHCRAGWVVTLAGDDGKKLEDRMGTAGAAMAIYLKSDPARWSKDSDERLPSFYCSNYVAMEDMRRMAEEEAAAAARVEQSHAS